MNRLLIPFSLVAVAILLVALQCTVTWRWSPWGVRLELLPPLLVYMAFTVNLPTAFFLGAFSALLYDSLSAGAMGASVIPYLVNVTLFSALRPIFFRSRLSTRFFNGVIAGFFTLLLQWLFSGKAVAVPFGAVLPKILRLATLCGLLSVAYFLVLDAAFRASGLNPGRFEEDAP
ncbi:MAG: hypothetical protein IT578_06110 [Verrucomicrobiae bacterium]|nr:hypothetical protein [Verrucomicrobiae bacterium]